MKQYRFRPADYIVYYDKVLVDFLNHLDIVSAQNLMFVDYIIKDADTPESIAFKVYGDSSLSWIILWLNNKIDPFFDWPLNTDEFEDFLANKYDDTEGVHHYELDGFVVNSNVKNAIPITNRQYEETKNQEKRNLKLPTLETMGMIINAI